ncbi:MAG: restriction endonuclease subunit S [Gemmatimonadetes bacterium]|nr:restriction endonuclease subunit S [Gemmatimonadota bacterium]
MPTPGEGWREITLGECAEFNDSTYSPKEAWPVINYLDTGSIFENRVSEIQVLESYRDKVPSRARRKVQPGDIVYSTVRPNQKHFGLLKDIPENFLASTGFAVLRGKEDIADTGFLYWFLAQDQIVDYLHSVAENSTSAYPSIRPSDLGQLTLSLPSLPEQRAIAHVLGKLDDKIEVNRQMNETLEAMARALFKSWFVDFEPVRAKMEGRWRRGESFPGLPAEYYNLFPDRLVESEIGEIPEGWDVTTLGQVCYRPQYGYTASANNKTIGPKFLRITDINKKAWIEWDSVPYCAITEEDFEKYQLHEGDILIARMADPGHGCIIEENQEAVFASYLIRFRPLHERYTRFLQYWLRSRDYWELVMGRGAGTTRISLNAKVLGAFPVLLPTDSLLDTFREQISGLRARVVANANESRAIAVRRDALMPELVSGRLRVGTI